MDGWTSEDQASEREELNFVEQQNGVLKLYPILDWDDRSHINTFRKTIFLIILWRVWTTTQLAIGTVPVK